jgi:hypothetical protein
LSGVAFPNFTEIITGYLENNARQPKANKFTSEDEEKSNFSP